METCKFEVAFEGSGRYRIFGQHLGGHNSVHQPERSREGLRPVNAASIQGLGLERKSLLADGPQRQVTGSRLVDGLAHKATSAWESGPSRATVL